MASFDSFYDENRMTLYNLNTIYLYEQNDKTLDNREEDIDKSLEDMLSYPIKYFNIFPSFAINEFIRTCLKIKPSMDKREDFEKRAMEVAEEALKGQDVENLSDAEFLYPYMLEVIAPNAHSSVSYCTYYFSLVLIIFCKDNDNAHKLVSLIDKIKDSEWVKDSISEERSVYVGSIMKIVEFIISSTYGNKRPEGLIGTIKPVIRLIIERYKKGTSALNESERDLLSFCMLAIQLFFRYIKPFNQNEDIKNISVTYYSYIVAGLLFRAKLIKEAITYAKQSLNVKEPALRQDAYNVLGICAIDTYAHKQLAYDTYYSWFQCRPCGELIGIADDFSQDEKEQEWRKVSKNKQALMYNNFAYVSATIGDTYDEKTSQQKAFYEIALKNIEAAYKIEKNDASYNCTYGSILYFLGEYDKAFDLYQQYEENTFDQKEVMDAARLCLSSYLDKVLHDIISKFNRNDGRFDKLFTKDSIKSYAAEASMLISKFQLSLSNPLMIKNEDANYFDNKKQEYDYIFRIQERGLLVSEDRGRNLIGLLLLLINQTTDNLINKLKRNNYTDISYFTREHDDKFIQGGRDIKPIVYYTSINNALYLFDEMYQDNDNIAPKVIKDGSKSAIFKNCLTLMHAKYMNDPDEGLTLLRALSNDITKDSSSMADCIFRSNPEVCREKIYDDCFVFLKAFTERIDTLDMWSMYGSDRNSGSNCNGCCIVLHPETFELVNSATDDKTLNPNLYDDYHLYRVIYLSDDYTIDKDKNPHISDATIQYYNVLKGFICLLNQELYNLPKDLLTFVQEFLYKSLRRCTFLFKSDSYAMESETRLLCIRTGDQLNLIRKIPQNDPNSVKPDRLCINPYFQVYINKIILGPNVKNTESWIPDLQYRLNAMKKPIDEFIDKNNKLSKSAVVRKSHIQYTN